MPDVTVTDASPTLTANNSNATYQWLGCDAAMSPIALEVGQSYLITSTGNYGVEVTENGCVDTSSCINVIITDIDDSRVWNNLNSYPNPTTGLFTIDFVNSVELVEVSILSLAGEMVYRGEFNNTSTITLNVTDYESGTYLVQLVSAGSVKTIQMIKIG